MGNGRSVTRVFDASALIALLKNEPGADVTRALLTDGLTTRLVHAVNSCEVFYHFARLGDLARAAIELDALEQGGLATREDMDRAFWQAVALLKAEIPHASLADCFVVILARRVAGTVVTADHPAFEAVAARGICPVTFIR